MFLITRAGNCLKSLTYQEPNRRIDNKKDKNEYVKSVWDTYYQIKSEMPKRHEGYRDLWSWMYN